MHSRRSVTDGFGSVRSRDAAWPSEARGSGRPGALGSLADTAAGRASRAVAGAWRPAPGARAQSARVARRSPAPPRPRAPSPRRRHTARAPHQRRSCVFFQWFCGNYMRVFLRSDFLYLIKIAEFFSHGTL